MKYSFATCAFALLLSCFALLQVVCGQIAAAQQLSAPRVGVIRYANGDAYLLYGLPGNYVVGPRVLRGADALSFSDSGGLVAQNGLLVLLRPDFSTAATLETGESNPILGLDGDLATAIAWLPSAQKLAHWNGQAFVSVTVPDLLREGDVSFVSKSDGKTAVLLLHSTTGSVSEVSVSLETGQILSTTPIVGALGPAYRQRSFVIYDDHYDLVVTAPANSNTTVKRLPLAGDDWEFERVSSDCLHLRSKTTQRNWLLHFGNNHFDLAELPAPPTPVMK